ncbi:MAG: sulfate adenylyltransferase subunit CysD [Rhodospirillaceae bacterium]
MSDLDLLEAESIHILREAVAEAERPVMLYSIGKDSSVMLHLAVKAFAPAPPPFPLLHIDTTWKFQEMIRFRDATARKVGMELLVHTNQEGVAIGASPFTMGSGPYTDMMKTQALKQAMAEGQWDMAFGGARRDEEASRAKERVFSHRDDRGRWEPRAQRPEPWKLFNTHKRKGESFRVFPLSDWTEIDIWRYILRERIAVVPLYMAKSRPTVIRDNNLIMIDDDRFPLEPGEVPQQRMVRFRTLGCYPLTAATESDATTLPDVVAEIAAARRSEREGRVIDHDAPGSMERKKREGYF